MSPKMLVADDSSTIQKVIQLVFAGEDLVIETVADGEEAVEKAKSLLPDIVLADVSLPGQSGYEVCEKIKSNPEIGHTPVVLLVGTFEQFDESKASNAKYDGFLTKPFDTSELIEIISSLLGCTFSANAELAEQQADMETSSDTTLQNCDARSLVSSRTRESFLGSSRILELFSPEDFGTRPAAAGNEETAVTSRQPIPAAEPQQASSDQFPDADESTTQHPPHIGEGTPQVIRFPGSRDTVSVPTSVPLSEDVFDAIVDKVVQRMSKEVVREVAWEVVPELADILIRECLDERKIPTKG